MIGYEMGSSPVEIYAMAKTSRVENFKHEWKMTWMPTWHHFLQCHVKFSRGQVPWATSNSWTTWPKENSTHTHTHMFILFAILSLPQLARLRWLDWWVHFITIVQTNPHLPPRNLSLVLMLKSIYLYITSSLYRPTCMNNFIQTFNIV